MPEIDGFEVCRRMKSNNTLKNIPIVFLTAVRGDKSIRIKALEVGAEGFLTKPIDEPELIAQINAMLKIKAANNDKETEKERLAILVEEKTKELRESNKKTLNLLNELKSEMQARENIELALQDSEYKFREIIETTNDIHFRLHINDYSIDYFSPSVYPILGYTIDDIFDMKHEIQTKLFHSEDLIDLTDIKNDLINVLKRGEKFIEHEFRMICKNKEVKWINGNFYLTSDINNKPIYIVGTLRDISERKKNEIANKVQYNIANAMVTAIDIHELYNTVRNELSKLIDTTNFIIALYDEKTDMLSTPYEIDEHDEGIIDEWSAEKSLTGLVVKNKKSYLLSKSDIAKLAFEARINLIGSRAESWLGVPMQIDEKVIGAIVVQSYNNPKAYNNESIRNLEIIAHELSIFIERKKTEEQLITAKERAEESDRLKTAFLQNMSHEIRTPLNGILGFASLLTDDELTADEVKKYANLIQNSGNRLFELINNIIDISKIESGNITIIEKGFSIDKLLDDIVNQFIITAEIKKIELRKIRNESAVENYIISDSLKIHQILTNLINNSLKFTKKGFVEIGYSLTENEIEFYIKDTGSGIPKEIGEKIFERFFQADTSMSRGFEGAGLGLSICQGLANVLKGRIWFESEIDKETIFHLKLPIKISNRNIMENEKKIPMPKLNNNTILIAEDDDTSYALLEMILNKAQLDVIRAINGLEAVEISRNQNNISCILMDIKMPVMNGIEATKQIKVFRPDLPIIAQTAYAFNTEREQVMAAGCNDYLTKPISKQLLMHLLDKHVNNNITQQ